MTDRTPANIHIFAAIAAAALFLGAAADASSAAEDPYAQLLAYDFGKSRQALSAIQTEIRTSSPQQHKAIEAKLLKALESPKATFACKQFVCRMLRRIGSDAGVPALAKLLPDAELSHMARFALEAIPGEAAGAALRHALGKVQGKLKAGVISSLGARRDAEAVAALSKLPADRNEDVAAAAIAALGRIGGAEAAAALLAANVSEKLTPARDDAYLACADDMLARGKAAEAAAAYRKMYQPSKPTIIRVTALRGIAQCEQAKAVPTVLAAMKDRDARVQRAAGKFLTEIRGPEASQAIAGQLPSLSPRLQVVMLTALGDRGDKVALPAVVRAVKSQEPAVRLAAIGAVGKLGGASEVPLLVGAAVRGGQEGVAAQAALIGMPDDVAEQALIGRLEKAGAEEAKVLIGVLAARRAAGAFSSVLQTLEKHPDSGVKAEAAKALAALAGEKDVPALVRSLSRVDPAHHGGLTKALLAAARQVKDPDKRVEPIVSAMPGATRAGQVSLLAVLGHLGGQKALGAVRSAVQSKDLKVAEAAVKALTDWPDATAVPALLKVARAGRTEVQRVLAFRGCVRLAGEQVKQGRIDEAMKMFRDLAPAAARPEEKTLLLGALRGVHKLAALELAVSFLKDAAVAREAGATAVELAKHLHRREPKAVSAAMQKVVAACPDKRIQDEAKRYIRK